MVDFIRNNIDRIMKVENSKISKLNKSTTVNKLSDRDKRGNNFSDQLNKKKRQNGERKYKRDERTEKQLLESNIIVDSSLNSQIEKTRKISELVKEKFVDNEELNKVIDFEKEEYENETETEIIDKILYNNKKEF